MESATGSRNPVAGALLTSRGRRAVVAVYCVAALASVVVYAVVRSPLYGLGQVMLFSIALVWVRWCLRRPRPAA